MAQLALMRRPIIPIRVGTLLRGTEEDVDTGASEFLPFTSDSLVLRARQDEGDSRPVRLLDHPQPFWLSVRKEEPDSAWSLHARRVGGCHSVHSDRFDPAWSRCSNAWLRALPIFSRGLLNT